MSCPSSMLESVFRSYFMALLDVSCTAVELGAHDRVEHGARVDLGGDLVDVADHVFFAGRQLGDDLDVPFVGLLDAVDRQVGAQESLGEGDRHRDRVGDHLEDLGGELGEPAGVQVAVLDQAEEHGLEVRVGALGDVEVRPRRRRAAASAAPAQGAACASAFDSGASVMAPHLVLAVDSQQPYSKVETHAKHGRPTQRRDADSAFPVG